MRPRLLIAAGETDALGGLKAAVLVTDGYEPSELTEPMTALRDAGADVTVVSNHAGTIKDKTDAGHRHGGLTLAEAKPHPEGHPGLQREAREQPRILLPWPGVLSPVRSYGAEPWMMSAAGRPAETATAVGRPAKAGGA